MAKNQVNIELKAEGGNAVRAELDNTAQSTKKLGETAGENSSFFERMGESISNVKTKIAGFIGVIGTLIEALRLWYDHVEKIVTAQQKLVESTQTMDQAAKRLASQANVMGSQQGIDQARGQVQSILRAGNLTDYGLAGDISVSAHSAFGASGALLSDDQLGIAQEVAGYAQRKGVGAAGVSSLFKTMSSMGVSNREDAQLAIQRLLTVQQASKSESFEDFMGGGIGAMMPALSQGASPEYAMSLYASALDKGNSATAATMAIDMGRLTQNDNLISIMARQGGMSENEFRELPYDEKMGMISEWIGANSGSGAGQAAIKKAGLSENQFSSAVMLFSPEQSKRQKMFMGLAKSATAAQFKKEADGFSGTKEGQIERLESMGVDAGASADVATRMGMSYINFAKEQMVGATARGENDPFTRDDEEGYQKFIFQPLDMAAREMVQDGTINDRQYYEWYTKARKARAISFVRSAIPNELGDAIGYLERISGSSAETIINNYSGPITIHSPPDMNPQPRVGRGDINGLER